MLSLPCSPRSVTKGNVRRFLIDVLMHSFSSASELFRLGLELIGRDNGEPGLIEHRHPLGDEHCFVWIGGGTGRERFDAAAVGVAEKTMCFTRKFKTANSMPALTPWKLAADFIRRNEIGDVTSDEEFAGMALKIVSGSTRLSQQEIIMISGLCP